MISILYRIFNEVANAANCSAEEQILQSPSSYKMKYLKMQNYLHDRYFL